MVGEKELAARRLGWVMSDLVVEETKASRVFHRTLGWGTKSPDGAFFTDEHGVVHPIRNSPGYDSATGDRPRKPKEPAKPERSANDIVREKIAKLPLDRTGSNYLVGQLRRELDRSKDHGSWSSDMTRTDAKRKVQEEYRTLRANGFSHEEVVRALLVRPASLGAGLGVGNVEGADKDLHEALSKDRIYKDETLTLEQHSAIARDFADEARTENVAAAAKAAAESQGPHMLADSKTFPEFARPQLTAVQDLIRRDGSLYPKGNEAVWAKHLAAVTKVGEAIQAETASTAWARAQAITQATEAVTKADRAIDEAFERAFLGQDTAHRQGLTEEERIAIRTRGEADWYAARDAQQTAGKVLAAAKMADGQANFDALAKIRPMGLAADLKIGHSTNPVAKSLVERAAPYYPKDWLARAADREDLRVGVANPPTRAFCRGFEVKVPSKDTEYGRSVALHEVGHFMENYGGRSIRASEYQFLNSRTHNLAERPESLRTLTRDDRYKPYEKTRKDDFASPYMGKTYGDTPTSNYELLTMGMENLRNRVENTPATDKQYRAWLLGTLATA